MMLRQPKFRPPLSARRFRFAIVCSEYNPEFTAPLLHAAEKELAAAGALKKNVVVVRVPGAFEIPVAAARLASRKKYDAILALGVVLQGKTEHARHILEAVSHHLQQIAVRTGVPVIHQVLSPSTEADARRRTAPGRFNRGAEGARAAVRMAGLRQSLQSR